ncbi:hypothetical protein [Roseobacter sinensis]|uniref:Glycosyltransferase n=1 Tax=Roseobacter sinensis TaxID=2931391 RepID=A0ABT3BCN2_9RHOB|nr:hypothetical protein [Roseobacter sp. WL0113]MCV3271317.1 hypothetical protein [Roseobacter sp. WL0113]
MSTPAKIAYVIDPRFRGGTSSAVAAELEVVSAFAKVEVYALSTAMFSGQAVAPQLARACARLNIPLTWDPVDISADLVILHNPSCLKFQDRLGTRILTDRLIVVTHENFVRPGGHEGFDVATCLDQIARASVALRRELAPISAWNRETVLQWSAKHSPAHGWEVLEEDWFNICAFDFLPPNPAPADRRGRHSRPGFEKFPGPAAMLQCFPETARRNLILGADAFLKAGLVPEHWDARPFGAMPVADYFDQIDFFVYFTAPTWRESFGRVLAEAIAAGKIAITDPETARTFSGAAIAAQPEQVNDIIASYIAHPKDYEADVRAAQEHLKQFSPDCFADRFGTLLTGPARVYA